MAVKKGDALKMMKKMPRGRYLTAIEKMMNENVPIVHLRISVDFRSLGMSEKKFYFCCFTITADAHMLKKERKNTNSKIVTPL